MYCINLIIAISISLKIVANYEFFEMTSSVTFFIKSYSSYPYFSKTISLRIKARIIGIAWTASWVRYTPSKIFLMCSCFCFNMLTWYTITYLAMLRGTSWRGGSDYLTFALNWDCCTNIWFASPLSIISN